MKTFLRFVLLCLALTLANGAQSAQNVLVLGDSLSAGYGIARTDSWVYLLQQRLKETHPRAEVVNASISGETTAGGLRRIGGLLQQHRPTVVILELGANDGLRGSAIAEIGRNLNRIVGQIRQSGGKVLLLGVQLPPNYGPAYTRQFRLLYPELAKRHGIALVPFMLQDITPEQFQTDNLHPDASAQPRILQNVLPALIPLLR